MDRRAVAIDFGFARSLKLVRWKMERKFDAAMVEKRRHAIRMLDMTKVEIF